MGNRQAAFGLSIALVLSGVSGARSTAWGATPGVQPSPAPGLRTDRLSAAQFRKWQAILHIMKAEDRHHRPLHPTLRVAGRKEVDAGQTAYEEAIGRAVRLLPRQPVAVVLIDRDRESRSRTSKARVEAFVNHLDPVVYVFRNGVCLQAALKGPGIYDYVLAIVIWHEMAHIDGADEAAAQEAEEQLWMKFILTQRVDRTRGMRYLALLRKRR